MDYSKAIKAFITKQKFIVITILIGFISHGLVSFPFAKSYCLGVQCGQWFADVYRARDELWHMALGSVAFESFPFRLPTYAGVALTGYHYLYGFYYLS